MNDTELQALAILVLAEVTAMNSENTRRDREGLSLAYGEVAFASMDCYKALDAELRRRAVLK